MYQHSQHQKHQEGEADPSRLDPGTKWQRLLDYLEARARRVGRLLRQEDPHLGYQEAQARLLRTLEELKTIERIREIVRLIDFGKDLPSSDAGDFLKADGVEVTDDDLYEDV
jgi:hypothetical protein